MYHDEGESAEGDHRFEDLRRVSQRFVECSLADGTVLDRPGGDGVAE